MKYDLAMPFWGIYTKELKTGTHTDICTPIFTAVSFIIAKGGSNPSVHL